MPLALLPQSDLGHTQLTTQDKCSKAGHLTSSGQLLCTRLSRWPEPCVDRFKLLSTNGAMTGAVGGQSERRNC